MGPLIGTFVNGLFGVLKQLALPLLAYFQGKKVAKLEGKEEALEDAIEAQEDRNVIDNMSDDDLSNIVFFDDEHNRD
jgi:hypothetical protein